MVLEAALSLSKCAGVVVAPPILHDRRHVVVEHFVKDDRLDEESRYPGLVEHGMNPDQAFFGKVCSELERALPAFGLNALAPGDPNIDSGAKVPAGEVVCYGAKIVVAPLVAQSLLWGAWGNETVAMRFDELVDGGRGLRSVAAQVVADRIEDVLVGRQEHVVKAQLEASAFGSSNEHGASIVGDDESNRLTEARRERAAPVGRTGISTVQIVRAAVGDAALRDRRRLTGKLEGKLEHPSSS